MAITAPEAVEISAGAVKLGGLLRLPLHPTGVVLFAHGSGSSRLSPRNNAVAEALLRAKLGSLLMDLLSEAEDADDEGRFDIGLLTQRLRYGAAWLQREARTRHWTGAGRAALPRHPVDARPRGGPLEPQPGPRVLPVAAVQRLRCRQSSLTAP